MQVFLHPVTFKGNGWRILVHDKTYVFQTFIGDVELDEKVLSIWSMYRLPRLAPSQWIVHHC